MLAQVDILIVNCSLFNPTPSLSAMIVNHFKMKSSIVSYNLSGMGCSAGVISISLAKELLQVCFALLCGNAAGVTSQNPCCYHAMMSEGGLDASNSRCCRSSPVTCFSMKQPMPGVAAGASGPTA